MKKRKNNDSVRAIIYLVTYFCCRFTFVLLNELVNKETQFTFKCCINVAKFLEIDWVWADSDMEVLIINRKHISLLNFLRMMFFDVLLQLRFCGKWFAAHVTILIHTSIMNPFDVFFQIPSFRKWLFTEFTLMIFLAFMNILNVSFQTFWSRRWFITRFTFVISLSFMDCLDMFLQIS